MQVDAIKAWLKKNKRSQAWLAEQVGVHVVSVNSWLNERAEISPPCKKLIALLMEADAPQSPLANTAAPLTLLSDEELETAASAINRTSQQLIEGVLVRDAVARAKAHSSESYEGE